MSAAAAAPRPSQDSHALLKAAVEATGMGVWEMNIATGQIFWSERCNELFFLSPSTQITYRDFLDTLHAEDWQRTDALVRRAFTQESGGRYRTQYRVVNRQQPEAVRWIEATGLAYFNAQGQAERFVGTVADVTADKLQDSEFRFLADTVPDFVWTARPDGQLDYYNRRFFEYTGLPEQDPATIDWLRLLHPNDQPRIAQQWAHCVQTGQPYEMEFRLLNRQGEYRWQLARGRCRRTEDGQIQRWYGATVDIEDQKHTQQILRSSEQRYELAALATDDAIWDWNLATHTVVWNPAIERVFGYGPADVAPTVQWWHNHIHPEDAERVVQGIQLVIDSPEQVSWQDTYRFRRANGTYAYVLDRGHIARNEQGQATRMIGTMHDVTAEREAQQALHQSEARFRQIAEVTPMIVWEADAQGNTTYLSPHWQQFTTTAEGLGLTWNEFVHPDDQQPFMEAWQAAVRDGVPFSSEVRLRVAATGEYRWYLDRAVPVRSAQNDVLQWIGAATDIQEQKELLMQLERAYSDLEAKVAFRNFDLEQQVRELRQQLEKSAGAHS